MSKKVVACYKWVLDEEDITLDSDLRPNMSKARAKFSEYDRNAIEAAVQLVKDDSDAQAVGLTVGDKRAAASQKEALARGLDETVLVSSGDSPIVDYAVLADVLAAQIGAMDDVEVVICSEGSSDQFGRQTGPRLAAVLGWPSVSTVSAMEIQGDMLKATRKLEDVVETVEVPLPVVVSVLPEISKPEMPGMRAILDARKKPSATVEMLELAYNATLTTEVGGVIGYKTERKNIVFEGDSLESTVAQFVDALRKEGVI